MLVRSGLLVRATPRVPTITDITVSLVSGTTFEVMWTANDMPFGTTFRIDWIVDSPSIGSGIFNNAVSPQQITADALEPSPSGSWTVDARLGGNTIATNNFTGAIIL